MKELRSSKFTNAELHDLINYYPYDLLFLCTHGGFSEGTRYEILFKDKLNFSHKFTFDVVDSFRPTDRGRGKDRIINVSSMYEFVDIDGMPWYQKKLARESSDTIVEDFLKLDRKDWQVLSKSDTIMRFCNIIFTKDSLGPYIPVIQSVSDPQAFPMIFNNSCISNYTLSTNFIYAGTGFYIGTVTSVDDSSAKRVALSYFNNLVHHKMNPIKSLWHAQMQTDIPISDRVYTCIGCHFMKVSLHTEQENRDNLRARLKWSMDMRYKKAIDNNCEENAKYDHLDALKLLTEEYEKLA